MEGYYTLPFVVMKLNGSTPDVEKFNQGVFTNTLTASRNASIDIYGKIVAVFYQKYVNGGFYIAFNKNYAQRLYSHLSSYLRLGKVRLEPTDIKVFFVVGERPEEISGMEIPEKNSVVMLSEGPPQGLKELTGEEFDRFRLENSVSMQGQEFDDDMIMNTDWGDAVSFTKGCFLGQEIVAKVTQRGRPPRKLVVREYDTEPESTEFVKVRSKCYSGGCKKWLAYCSVPNE